jgi:hypothetical protein
LPFQFNPYHNVIGMSREKQLELLDANSNGKIDYEESEKLVTMKFGLYYTKETKGGGRNDGTKK